MALPSNTLTVTRPAGIVAADNPVVISISTNSIGSPDYAKGKLKILSSSTDSRTLTFTLTGNTTYTKTFTGAYYPNSDDKFMAQIVQDANGNNVIFSITDVQVASSLADCLKKDVILSRDYYIDYSGSTIIEIIARAPGAKFSLNNKVVSSSPSTISYTNISNGADQYGGSTISDYNLYVDVYKGNDGLELGTTYSAANFKRITELVLPFSSDNIHRFDVSTITKAFVSTFQPSFTATGFTTDQNTTEKYLMPFVFQYGEQFPLIAGTNTTKRFYKGTTAQVFVANASLPFTSGNTLMTYTGGTSSTQRPFLTSQPATKLSHPDQQELLYAILRKDVGSQMNVMCNLTFWDGSTTTGITLYNVFPSSVNYGGLYCLNVSHQYHLKQYETSTNKIKQAEIWLKVSTTIHYSKSQVYLFPYNISDSSYGITFKNSFGVYDTFNFIGVKEETIDRQKKDMTLPLDINANGSISRLKSGVDYDVQVTKKIVVNSGLIDERHFNWLIDLFKSSDIYEYSTGIYLKLDSFQYTKNNQTNDYSIDVTFIQTLYENTVTV